MEHWKLENWCFEAVEKIKYRPDRDAVYNELLQHLDDRCESFIAQGMTKDDAVRKTVEVMGDPGELSVQLAAIHRPFWGFAYSITKWLMRIVAVIAVICTLFYIFDNVISRDVNTPKREIIDAHYTRPTDPNVTRFVYTEPNCSDSSDGYTFTVTRAALHHYTSINSDKYLFAFDGPCLYIEVKVSSINPWAGKCQGIYEFWGIDDQGHIYTYHDSTPLGYMSCTLTSDDTFTQYYTFTIVIEQPEDCTWFELHYDRDGRDVVLHIDLTGGGEA
ncbi:MAG: hypothetical protein E7448_02520 [Ruminococcaceae bacterium]|nr:hypothetical protein [Oscillospiraceae bacterium]